MGTPDTYITSCKKGHNRHPSNSKANIIMKIHKTIYLNITWVKKSNQLMAFNKDLNYDTFSLNSLLTQCISVWYGNLSNQDCKALQRVVRLAERISGSALPSLQDIYLKRYKSRADKIIKNSNHPGNCLFNLLPSGKR